MPSALDGLRPHHQIAIMLTLPALTLDADAWSAYLDLAAETLGVPRETFEAVFHEAWGFLSTDFRGSYAQWEKSKSK